MLDIYLREATTHDLPQLVEIKLAAEQHSVPFKKFTRTPEDELVYLAETAQRCSTTVAIIHNKLVGFIAFGKDYIDQLFVHPDFQHQGIGSALLGRAQETRPYLHISVINENKQAIDFYLRHGFRFDGKIENTNGSKYSWKR